jgi:GT2 family glycosyltransferase
LKLKYNFKLFFQENRGVSYTLNLGIKDYANGEYITFCASDDYWLPDKIVRQVKFLEENPDIPMVFGKSKIIDFKGSFLEEQTTLLNKGLKGGKIFKEIIFQEFHPPVNYMYRSVIFKEIGFFDEDAWAEDFDMNLRIANKYPIGFIDYFLACYRRGMNSNSSSLPYRIINSHIYSINKFRRSEYYTQAILRWHYRNFLWFACRKNSKLFAIKSMFQSISFLTDKMFIKGIRDLLMRWY